ncbi:MAG: SRPBCC domain-containing protein [Xanthomonadales bacterium]|nr:SRPBCC domain-containing protein [Xanthomonadales bacterium]
MNPLGILLTAIAAGAPSTPDVIEHHVVVPASLEAVWSRWTTAEGLTRFFARSVNLDLRVGGDFEILFFPENEPGLRGAEGTRLMAVEAPRRLAFDWDAPPQWPHQRGQRTMVEVRLAPSEGGTRISLRHHGWGDGPQWQEVRDYFDRAWQKVLARLVYSFEVGPVNWDAPPPELMHRG